MLNDISVRCWQQLIIFIFLAFITGCLSTADPSATNNTENNNSASNNDNNTPTECTDRCTEGDIQCDDDAAVITCIRQPNGCLDFGNPQECYEGEVCTGGKCVESSQACSNYCIEGDMPRCDSDGMVISCGDHNQDGCLEYGGPTACGVGEVCVAASGQCASVTCQHACELNDSQCEGSRITSCFEDAAGCRRFSAGQECPAGETCQGGACVATQECPEECRDNDSVCTSSGEVRLCGDWNDDGCVTYSEPVACSANEECYEGECIPLPPCENECFVEGNANCFGNKISVCSDHNGNGCISYNEPTDCANIHESCQVDDGHAACAPDPDTGFVLINEVFYDAIGADVRGTGSDRNSPTFIELYGTPGLSIEGFRLDMINGTNGDTYNTATLPEGATLDGYGFAVIAMDTPDTFLMYAAPHLTNVYYILEKYSSSTDALRNGPDSIILYDDANEQVDALGYGRFGSNIDNFKGLGEPASNVTAGRSLGRSPNRPNTGNNADDFLSFYPTPGIPNADLLINEVYFNQPGQNDGSETFIELIAPIGGWEDLPLDGYVVRGIKGSDGTDYLFNGASTSPGIALTDMNLNDDDSSGYLVICNDAAVEPLRSKCNAFYDGAPFYTGPDNIVLEYRGRVVDAVGYGQFQSHHTFAGKGTPVMYRPTDTGKSVGRWPNIDPTRNINQGNNALDFLIFSPTPGRMNPYLY